MLNRSQMRSFSNHCISAKHASVHVGTVSAAALCGTNELFALHSLLHVNKRSALQISFNMLLRLNELDG